MYHLSKFQYSYSKNVIQFYIKNHDYINVYDNVPAYASPDFFVLLSENIANNKALAYCMWHDDQLIGMIYIEEINRNFYQSASLSFCIDADYASRGITTYILKKYIPEFLVDANISRVKCIVDVDNIASISILRKLDFQVVGPILQYFKINNVMKDCYIAYTNIN